MTASTWAPQRAPAAQIGAHVGWRARPDCPAPITSIAAARVTRRMQVRPFPPLCHLGSEPSCS